MRLLKFHTLTRVWRVADLLRSTLGGSTQACQRRPKSETTECGLLLSELTFYLGLEGEGRASQ